MCTQPTIGNAGTVVCAVGAPAGVAPYGTDASELQVLAPCVILGPGDIAQAHAPDESVSIADLAAAVPLFMQLAHACSEERCKTMSR